MQGSTHFVEGHPHFASITLLASPEGVATLERYFRSFLDLAVRKKCGIVLESATWRASPDWAEPLGYSGSELDSLNSEAIALLQRLRDEYRAELPGIVISGCIGPRGDGYDPEWIMTVNEAQAYHAHQIGKLVTAGVDQVSAITMTNVPEAIGTVLAAGALSIPVAISFTLETDGRLPTGETLGAAIAAVDAVTDGYSAYFMINCAHLSSPAHALRRPRCRRSLALRTEASFLISPSSSLPATSRSYRAGCRRAWNFQLLGRRSSTCRCRTISSSWSMCRYGCETTPRVFRCVSTN